MDYKKFELKTAKKNVLSNFETKIKSTSLSDDEVKEHLKESQDQLSKLQELLYAQNQWSVLLVLQGMDTAGKDSLIESVMKSVNPQGCEVTSFKQPSHLELAHDFLWRAHNLLPKKGMIGVFNRSYYEDIIVPYVHPNILDTNQLPSKLRKSKSLLKDRCSDIVNFENYLARQGVVVIKIFLHLSKQEQKNRLIRRLELADKKWKFDPSDIVERGYWSKYQKAYNFCFENTANKCTPWHIIPAVDKPISRLMTSKIICDKLADLNLSFPRVTASKQKQLATYLSDLKR